MKNFNPNDPTNLLRAIKSLFPNNPVPIDSATLNFLHEFQQLAITDGGDDLIADLDADTFITLMIPHITAEDIIAYDNSDENTDSELFLNIYIRIRNTMLGH